jgi:hypothetical protein
MHFSSPFEDGVGKSAHEVTWRVNGIERVTTYEGTFGTETLDDPAYDVWQVDLDFKAPTDSVLALCNLALTDEDGNRFTYDSYALGLTMDIYPCVPGDAVGPNHTMEGEQREMGGSGAPRPAEWSTTPIIVAPKGVEITGVRLWWTAPRYAQVSLDRD